MDVVAETMAFVVVLIAMDVEQVELVNQAVALEHVERAIDGDAVNARIDLLRQLENRPGVQVPLGIIHHLKQDAALAREAYAALGEGGLQAAGPGVSVQAFAAGDAMSASRGHEGFRQARPPLVMRQQTHDVMVHDNDKQDQNKHHANLHKSFLGFHAQVTA